MKKLFIVLSTLFLSINSFAENDSTNKTMEEGFYVGFGFNSSQNNVNGKKNNSGNKLYLIDKTQDGFIGELQYNDLGYNKSQISADEIQLKYIAYSLLINIDVGGTFFPYLKLGYSAWNTRNYIDNTNKPTKSGNSFIYGLGLSYKFSKRWYLKFEYESLGAKYIDTNGNENLSINVSSLSFMYKI